MTARWTTLLADLALLLVAATAAAHEPAEEAASSEEGGATAAFAVAYAPGAADSPQAHGLPAWLARTRDDGALGLVVTVSMDERDRAAGATLALAARRAERLLATLDERRPVEVRLSPTGGRTATVALRYD